MEELPFVSCLCIAGKSAFNLDHLLPQAATAFQEQTYSADRRELIVVWEPDRGHSREIKGLRENVRPVAVAGIHSLGHLRNVSLDHAKGDLMCQWDSDDWFHPTYIEKMVERQRQRPELPLFLKRQLCYSFNIDTAFVREYDHTFIHGANLYPRSEHRYPDQGREEDTVFLCNWPERWIYNNDPNLYLRLEHGDNTWPPEHILGEYGEPWALGGWHLCDEHREYLRGVLRENYGALLSRS